MPKAGQKCPVCGREIGYMNAKYLNRHIQSCKDKRKVENAQYMKISLNIKYCSCCDQDTPHLKDGTCKQCSSTKAEQEIRNN